MYMATAEDDPGSCAGFAKKLLPRYELLGVPLPASGPAVNPNPGRSPAQTPPSATGKEATGTLSADAAACPAPSAAQMESIAGFGSLATAAIPNLVPMECDVGLSGLTASRSPSPAVTDCEAGFGVLAPAGNPKPSSMEGIEGGGGQAAAERPYPVPMEGEAELSGLAIVGIPKPVPTEGEEGLGGLVAATHPSPVSAEGEAGLCGLLPLPTEPRRINRRNTQRSRWERCRASLWRPVNSLPRACFDHLYTVMQRVCSRNTT